MLTAVERSDARVNAGVADFSIAKFAPCIRLLASTKMLTPYRRSMSEMKARLLLRM
jgi:hypothetical protein